MLPPALSLILCQTGSATQESVSRAAKKSAMQLNATVQDVL